VRKVEVRCFLDPPDVRRLDELVRRGYYRGRSDAVRDLVRRALRSWIKIPGEG
jgi:Arc/MetJ-type ribon-helix-helix transcriptional regulator